MMALTPPPERVVPWLSEIERLAHNLASEYVSTYPSGYSRGSQPAHGEIVKSNGATADPTGYLATNAYYQAIRDHCKESAKLIVRACLDLQQATAELRAWQLNAVG